MTRGLIRLFVFALFFSVEVRVHADILWDPKNCGVAESKSSGDCIGLVRQPLSEISIGDGQLRLLRKTVVKKNSEREYTLVAGTLMIVTESPFSVKHISGEVQLTNATVLLVSTNRSLEIFPLKASVFYKPRGSKESYRLDAGYTQSLGRVDTTGLARVLLPKPASVDKLIPLWVSMTQKTEFESTRSGILAYRQAWKSAVDQAGPWYQDLIQRQIASLNQERETERRRQQDLEKEQNFLRDMFKRRNFLE